MAWADGFEPSNPGVKVLCLTVWLRPNMYGGDSGNRTHVHGCLLATNLLRRSRCFATALPLPATGFGRTEENPTLNGIFNHRGKEIFPSRSPVQEGKVHLFFDLKRYPMHRECCFGRLNYAAKAKWSFAFIWSWFYRLSLSGGFAVFNTVSKPFYPRIMAEGKGFEPLEVVRPCGFRDRCLRPLGQPSVCMVACAGFEPSECRLERAVCSATSPTRHIPNRPYGQPEFLFLKDKPEEVLERPVQTARIRQNHKVSPDEPISLAGEPLPCPA